MNQVINVLIVEDNLDDLELLLLELQKGEYEFTYTHCKSRLTFESELISNIPDIIISDYNLPSYSGLEALIETRKTFPHIPFLLLSSFIGEAEGVKMIVDYNANDYILKNDLHRLNPAVSREIKHSLIRRELDSKNDELQLLSMAVKQTHQSIIITDTEGRIEWVNEAYTNLTEYTLEESLGKKPGPLLQGEKTDPSVIQIITDKLKLQTPFQQEILNYTKTGDHYWIKLDISPVFDGQGNLSKFVAIQEDITKKRNNERKYRNLFNNLIDEVHLWKFITDKNGNVTNWELVDANPSALTAWGKTKDQVVGKTPDKIFNPETKELFKPIVEKIFKSGRPESWELFFPLTDQFLSMTSIPYDDYFISTGRDITEQRNLQDTIQRSLDEKSILLSEIHHRVKNNLAIISGLLDLQALETKSEEISSIVLTMGQRIKSIAGVHELLYKSKDFSNIPFIEYVDILLKNINNTLRNNKSVAFDISIDNSVIININQAVPVGLLMNELITNSFKYAFNKVDKPKITFSMKYLKGMYHAEYTDNGPGVDIEFIETSNTLGFTLIRTLLAQIVANYTFNNENGFKLNFNFSPQDSGAQGNKVNL